jgi:hypothetical protein
MNEYWEILELEPTTDYNLVKRAYAKLIKQFKPDQHPEKFKIIRNAYEIVTNHLNDPEEVVEQNDSHASETLNADEDNDVADPNELELQVVMDMFYSLYTELDTRNDVAAWREVIQKYSVELSLEPEFGLFLIRNLIKNEYLYKTEKILSPDVFILLFDFFEITLDDFLFEEYHPEIATDLSNRISQRRFELNIEQTVASNLNKNNPYYEAQAENFLHKQILRHDIVYLQQNVNNFINQLRKEDPGYFTVLRRVAFRYMLEQYTRPDRELNEILAGFLYYILHLRQHKKDLMRTFVGGNYNTNDLENCLAYSKAAFLRHIRTTRMQIEQWLVRGYVAFMLVAIAYILI